jgi:hypothetical protein
MAHGMTVDAKTGCKLGLGRELCALRVKTLPDVAAQRGGDGFPNRCTGVMSQKLHI